MPSPLLEAPARLLLRRATLLGLTSFLLGLTTAGLKELSCHLVHAENLSGSSAH